MTQFTDISGRDSGSIWSRKPPEILKDGAPLCEVSNTVSGLTAQGRHLQFTKIAFGYHGNWFIAGDQHGSVYHFNLSRNRFKLLLKAGHSCTALACCISRPNEVLVALADYTIKCIDTESCEVVAVFRGHEASVKSLSLHSSGRSALAVSSRDSVLWDLDTFSRLRTLNGGQDVGVQDVFFQPMSGTILTCFKDDSIHAWESETLVYRYQIPPPFGPAPHYRAFATPRDGRLLVAGGRSRFLHVWSMETRRLLRVVQLPAKIRLVKQLLFLPDHFDGGSSEVLGFLAQDGVLRFINVHSCKLLFQAGSHDQMLSCVQVSPDGRHVVAVSEPGNLLIFDVASLSKHLHKPPAPLVKVMNLEQDSPEEVEVGHKRMKTKHPRRARLTDSSLAPPTSSHSRKPPLKATPLVPRPSPPSGTSEGLAAAAAAGAGSTALDEEKLHSILRGYGEYPTKYRTFIWRCLLRLPENYAAYSSLLDKGTHPSFASLHKTYPIKSRKLLRVLQRTLSALAHWSSIFGETSYLPTFVFPFVKLFQNNQLVTFELLATILLNWCSQWFEYFPNPPLNVLAMLENCLAHHDATLLEHFIKHNMTSQHYAWPLLESAFSEVLSQSDWLRLWDNLLSNHASFLLLVGVAYLTTARHTLLQCSSLDDLQYFTHNQSAVDVGQVIREAYRLQETTPPDIHPAAMLEAFAPLTRGTYPVFNRYPKFIVDYQATERERIRQEELDYLRERQSALELERLAEGKRQEEGAWYRQQELLLEAEQHRRALMEGEERKLAEQRARLQALKRELKVKELHVLDATRRRFLQHQQRLQEGELRRVDHELQRRVTQREEETKTVLHDIEIRALELERQKAMLEQDLAKRQEEMVYQLHTDEAAQRHREELEQSMLERAVEEEGQREREKLDAAHTRLARLDVQRGTSTTLQQAGARRDRHDAQQERRMGEVVGRSDLNRLKEKQIHRLLKKGVEEGEKTQLAEEQQQLAGAQHSTSRRSGRVEQLLRSTAPPSSSSSETSSGSTDSTRGPTTTAAATATSKESLGRSALQWSRRREVIDRQEAELMSRVRELRQKLVQGHHNTAASSST